MSEKTQVSSTEDVLFSVLAGGLAGVAGVCITNPFDTLRVRLSAGAGATGKNHKSLYQTAVELFREGTVHTLTRGLGANIFAAVPSLAVYFSTYRWLHTWLSDSQQGASLGPDGKKGRLCSVDERLIPFLSACGAVVSTNALISPLFVIRTRVQVSDKVRFRDVARSIWLQEGMKGFYRGTLTNTLGRVVEEGTFWTLYEYLEKTAESPTFRDRNERSFLVTSLAVVSLSMVSKLTATTIAYPYNVVMNHLRTVHKATGRHVHTAIFPTIRHVFLRDGFFGFYKGLAPHLLRSVAAMSTQMYFFELVMYHHSFVWRM